ncbi:MAG: hypothetical protein AAF317_06200 [Pseudomonadota bacterium]
MIFVRLGLSLGVIFVFTLYLAVMIVMEDDPTEPYPEFSATPLDYGTFIREMSRIGPSFERADVP